MMETKTCNTCAGIRFLLKDSVRTKCWGCNGIGWISQCTEDNPPIKEKRKYTKRSTTKDNVNLTDGMETV